MHLFRIGDSQRFMDSAEQDLRLSPRSLGGEDPADDLAFSFGQQREKVCHAIEFGQREMLFFARVKTSTHRANERKRA